MLRIRDLDALGPSSDAGAKAQTLARLRRLGLPVPTGFVVLPGERSAEELPNWLSRASSLSVVRSSSSMEDGESGAAPGIFESYVRVPREEIEAQIENVRASALSDKAAAYARAKNLDFPGKMAVLVQPFLGHSSRGTIYSRQSSTSDSLIIEAMMPGLTERAVVCRRGECPEDLAGLSREHANRLVELTLEIEGLLKVASGVDVEWLVSDDTLWIVQARPLTQFPPATRLAPPSSAFDFANNSDLEWHWDVAHNPGPLSQVQQDLVELVADELGFDLKLACGYLYEGRTNEPIARASSGDSSASLEARFFEDIGPRLEECLSATESAPTDLERALACFLEVNRVYDGELRPALKRAREQLGADEPTTSAVGIALLKQIADPSSDFSSAARRYAQAHLPLGHHGYWGPYSERWDVLEPSFEEKPAELAKLAARLDIDRPSATRRTHQSRVIGAIAELDDRLFYRAQRQVRRAVLALPGAPRGELRFELSLDLLRLWQKTHVAPKNALEIAKKNQTERETASKLKMPLRWPPDPMLDRPDPNRAVLCGEGVGERRTGIISSSQGVAGSILVARDLTPGDIMRAMNAEAIILEDGTLLGHAAALARELGMTLMINVAHATRTLRDGETVSVDPKAGLIIRLG